MAQHPREDGNFHSPQHMREHSPELRVSDIPAETMTVISDCQVPLMLVGITWPYDLIKSPLLYANTAMLNLIGGNSEADHLAGLSLGSLFRIEGPVSRRPGEAESYPVRLAAQVQSTDSAAPAVNPLAGTLMFVPVKDRLGRPAQQFAGFLAEDAAPLERRLVASLLQASALALAQSVEAATARSTLNTVLSSLTDAFMSVDHAWCFTRVNRMAAQACGMAPEDMIGRSFWELFPEAIGSPLQAAAHRAESEQVPVQAEAFHPRFGRWSEYHVYPSPDGLGIIETDITSRKQQEARQRLMADLNEAIRLLVDPTEMMEVALVLTGRHFGASRMVFAEIEPTTLCVGAYRQYVDGAPDFPGDMNWPILGRLPWSISGAVIPWWSKTS